MVAVGLKRIHQSFLDWLRSGTVMLFTGSGWGKGFILGKWILALFWFVFRTEAFFAVYEASER